MYLHVYFFFFLSKCPICISAETFLFARLHYKSTFSVNKSLECSYVHVGSLYKSSLFFFSFFNYYYFTVFSKLSVERMKSKIMAWHWDVGLGFILLAVIKCPGGGRKKKKSLSEAVKRCGLQHASLLDYLLCVFCPGFLSESLLSCRFSAESCSRFLQISSRFFSFPSRVCSGWK